MTETIKQAISALMDEEASEIEVHRLLRHLGDDPSIKESWIRFQQIRSVTQNESLLSSEQHLALHSRISAAVDEEEAFQMTPASMRRRWKAPVAGLAVAASLVVAVFLGINSNQVNLSGQPVADSQILNPVTAPINNSMTGPISVQPVANMASDEPQYSFNEDEPELRELDAAKQQRLREYLLRHDRQSRMNSNTRTVDYQPSTGNR